MGHSEILEKLSELLGDVLVDDVVLRAETTAKDVPGWDSLTNVRFVLAVQQAFNVRLAAGEVGRLKCVGDLVTLIEQRT
jgi:acyl carrier protein